MGNVGAQLMRPAKSYNIVNRAQKVINKEKPVPAPTYPSTAKQIEIADEVDPNFMESHNKQDPALHDRLKQVFVSSNVQFAGTTQRSEKLPQNTKGSEEWDYGFWQPDKAPKGKVLLRDALKFMSDHMTDPKNNDAKTIATQYKLDQKDVDNILEYYRVFQILVPPKETHPGNIQLPTFRNLMGESSKKIWKGK
ncbi:protein NDUFAF4 homolog [Diachasmimorpha longicaudata]|uniref:protein NDUFAF4 homolog n=1 Tax=Diachasmimorpha longicaudata TaxID=58733 RepID=UPI0030B86FC9